SRKAARQRCQIDMVAEIPFGETCALQPDLQERPRRPGEVVALLVTDRARRLADEHHFWLGDQCRPNRIRPRQVARHFARAARDHLGRELLQTVLSSAHPHVLRDFRRQYQWVPTGLLATASLDAGRNAYLCSIRVVADRRDWRGGCAGWSDMTQRCSTALRV